jgi:TUG ubiquitin-like domain
VKIDLTENMVLNDVLKEAFKKLGVKDNYKQAKLYNKNGIPLFQDDLMLLNDADVLYIALKGKKSLSSKTFT